MTIKEYFNWFKVNWPKTCLIVSVFIIVYLLIIVLPNNLLLFTALLAGPLYMIHEFDEYVYPGGFQQFMNKNIYKLDPENGMLDNDAAFWINIIAVWTLIPLFSLWAVFDIRQVITLPYFFIFQAVLHLILGIVGKQLIHPGIISAWLIHVPWGVLTIYLLTKNGVIKNPFWNDDVRGALFIVAALALVGCILMIRYKRKKQVAS
jgi:hypothetical protein